MIPIQIKRQRWEKKAQSWVKEDVTRTWKTPESMDYHKFAPLLGPFGTALLDHGNRRRPAGVARYAQKS